MLPIFINDQQTDLLKTQNIQKNMLLGPSIKNLNKYKKIKILNSFFFNFYKAKL